MARSVLTSLIFGKKNLNLLSLFCEREGKFLFIYFQHIIYLIVLMLTLKYIITPWKIDEIHFHLKQTNDNKTPVLKKLGQDDPGFEVIVASILCL